jgi:UDP-N-acetylglucosamine 2-epimerase (non-hydrolysing)
MNKKIKIISVVGARPNFIKVAPFIKAIKLHNQSASNKIDHLLVHTGQHYDARMSETFFKELDIPMPDINLEIGSGSHAEQVGHTMIAFEKIVKKEQPDWVVVLGDVNATIACSITAKKEKIKCCHIEAGLRSYDIEMPEEINRLVTDKLADLLLTPDRISSENLFKEGVSKDKVVFVGNIMIDTLNSNLEKASSLKFNDIISENCIVENRAKIELFSNIQKYGLITMHRPSNVDDKIIITEIIDWFVSVASKKVPFIWPVHPRTLNKLKEYKLLDKLVNCENILLLHPLGYHEMLKLNSNSSIMLTDSGGLQEECTVLGVPFLTLRENEGSGYLVGNNIEKIQEKFDLCFSESSTETIPELWDGNTANRCLQAIINYKD